ncbi:probable protein phosphatase 2C 75 [Ziziphus jujuba]|uniref:Probable protein phosphatase 2C 75 n=1 Tax=Ziziphus jujuba TaxID=326968 RepID=A0ABM3IEK8_ZIZJJ|nr:probable protein phosphatase 2C 75 [Ziziphus jujuba]
MARLAEFFPTPISTASGGDSPEKCPERRRRRIELRRSRCSPRQLPKVSCSEGTQMSDFVSRGQKRHFMEDHEARTSAALEVAAPSTPVAKLPVRRLVRNLMPIFAAISTAGNMDERLSVKEDFCRPQIIGGQPLHLFAVFDGRGNPHVSILCKELMHLVIGEELTRLNPTGNESSGGSSSQSKKLVQAQLLWAMNKSFHRVDIVSQGMCLCGKTKGISCACNPLRLGFGGSAAVVIVLTADSMIIANFGRSRAVLCRAGKAISLSNRPKSGRNEEVERLLKEEEKGRPYEILMNKLMKTVNRPSGPEILIVERAVEDECLILASNGLWDVIPESIACGIASRTLGDEIVDGVGVQQVDLPPPNRPNQDCNNNNNISSVFSSIDNDTQRDARFPCKSGLVATILCRLALGRGRSNNNVSVMVVDLKSN